MVYSGKPLICLAEPVSFQIRESNPTVFLGKKMFSNKKMFPQYRIELKEGCSDYELKKNTVIQAIKMQF